MYSFVDKVRYSEVDKFGNLSIAAIVNFMQDCSTLQSDYLGVGLKYLTEKHQAWVLNSWQIDFLEDIRLGEEIEIGTWAYDAKGIYGYRNFLIQSPEKKPLVKANSLWVFLNTDTKKPEKATEEAVAPYGREPKLDMEYLDRKIKITGEGRPEEPFRIRRYHIDTNNHVNNRWYIQFAMEYFAPDETNGQQKIKRLRVEYKNAAVYADMIYPVVYEEENGITVSLNDEDGKIYAIVQILK
jgi:acyl-ACP thioesterase